MLRHGWKRAGKKKYRSLPAYKNFLLRQFVDHVESGGGFFLTLSQSHKTSCQTIFQKSHFDSPRHKYFCFTLFPPSPFAKTFVLLHTASCENINNYEHLLLETVVSWMFKNKRERVPPGPSFFKLVGWRCFLLQDLWSLQKGSRP